MTTRTAPSSFTVRRLRQPTPGEIQALTELLIDCVDGGASVSFMLPLSTEKARQFWLGVAVDAARGARVLLVVEGVWCSTRPMPMRSGCTEEPVGGASVQFRAMHGSPVANFATRYSFTEI